MRFVDSSIRRLTLVATLAVAASGCGGGSGSGFPDTTPPSVVSTDPPVGAVGVQPGDPIIATFNEPLDPASVTAASFQVTDNLSNPVNGTVSVSGRTARFMPAQNALVKSALYQATLAAGIRDSSGNLLAADVDWSFMTTADLWTMTAVNASTASQRSDHTAVWTGSEMIVWGGTDAMGALNTGARYNPGNPAATAWTPTADSDASVPLARTDHTAVWTGVGGEMIVWGGELAGAPGPTNTGGRYSPATDLWTTTPLPPPDVSARSLHTALWTGSRMIVWGGLTTGGSRTNSGGVFNPSGAGSWTPTSMSEPASPRSGHSAVWTGTEMIVWGGMDNDDMLTSTGRRYRLATNDWRTVANSATTPSARVDHSAIWTGTEMIVWGGDDGSGPVASGARYNPVTDTWSPMQDAPIVRGGHTAIWTGTEMIVWGGELFDPPGAAYNPAHDTWRSIATDSAPSGRADHTAVWTGSEMIVWGGSDGMLTNTGGRYAP